ncbi:MAG: hypothetical protein WC890_07690 [Candidatus Margulisiibacteriota bacterium]
MSDGVSQAAAPQKPTSYLPYMWDVREKDEETKKGPKLKYVPPQPSLGALYYSQEGLNIPIAYGKIEQGVQVTSNAHRFKFVNGLKWGSPLTEAFNPNGDTVVTYHEAEAAYDYTFGNGFSLGVVAEDRQKFSGANWLRAMAAVQIPYSNTLLRAGALWHLQADRGAPLQEGTSFSWQVAQPLAGVKGEKASATMIIINEGEYSQSFWWMNNILALKIKY